MERFDVVEQEQLAAQVVALMDAHFQRPTVEQKNRILRLASDQIRAASSSLLAQGAEESPVCHEALSGHSIRG